MLRPGAIEGHSKELRLTHWGSEAGEHSNLMYIYRAENKELPSVNLQGDWGPREGAPIVQRVRDSFPGLHSAQHPAEQTLLPSRPLLKLTETSIGWDIQKETYKNCLVLKSSDVKHTQTDISKSSCLMPSVSPRAKSTQQ